jgi:hypothetical protein
MKAYPMGLERTESIIEVWREIGARLLVTIVLVAIATAFAEFVICLIDDMLNGLILLSDESGFTCGLRVEGCDVYFLRSVFRHKLYKSPFEQ